MSFNPVRLACASVAASVVLLACGVENVTAQPATTAPATQPTTAATVRTQLDVIRELKAFEERFIIDAYAKSGHHDARWDEAATQLLRAQVDANAYYYGVNRYYEAQIGGPVPMASAERCALATKILDAGCDDPIVLYMAGRVLAAEGQPRADEAFVRAEDELDASSYAPILKFKVLQERARAMASLPPGSPALVLLEKRTRAALRNVFTDRQTLPEFRASVWEMGEALFESHELPRIDPIAVDLEAMADQVDPWLYHTFLGAVEIRRAWASRGSGYADTVNEQGWKGFVEHLAKSQEHLMSAEAADATLPHAPGLLITVALGMNEPADGLKWFQAAIARRMDFPYAWSAARQHVMPRWGGSPSAQLRLARRAVDTGRFDTNVPAMVLDVASDMMRDQERPLTPAEAAPLFELITRAMDGYLATRAHVPRILQMARSEKVAWLEQYEGFDEARALLEQMNTITNQSVIDAGGNPSEIIGHIYAMTSPAGPVIKKAMALRDPAKRAAALEAVLPVISAAPVPGGANGAVRGESSIRWVKRAALQANFLATLSSGEWTAIPLDPELTFWEQRAGKWSVVDDGKALLGTAENGLGIVSPYQMPERFELRCTLEWAGPEDHRFYRAEVAFPAWSPSHPLGVYADGPRQQMMIKRQIYRYATFPFVNDIKRMPLYMRYDRGALMCMEPDGKPMGSARFPMTEIRRFAFGGDPKGSGCVWKVSGIEVRQLK